MVLYKTTQQVGKATIAVDVREEVDTEVSVDSRGGDGGRRRRFGRLSASRSFYMRENELFEEPRVKITRTKKWVRYVDWRSSWATVWATAGGALDVVGDWVSCVGLR